MAAEQEPDQNAPAPGDEKRAPTREELLRELEKGARGRPKYKETIEPPPTPGDPGGTVQPPSHRPEWGY
jgi:hypothetical protein